MYKMVDGELLPLTAEELAVLPSEIDMVKSYRKAQIKQAFLDASQNPIVDTGLGFSVDGGRENHQDFLAGQKYAIPQVRAYDNTMHNVTLADYVTIISAIEQNGIALYQKKWALEAQIDRATAIEELEAISW